MQWRGAVLAWLLIAFTLIVCATGKQVDYEKLKCDLKEWLDAGILCTLPNCTNNQLEMELSKGQGPLIVRLAWHCSGTYHSGERTGGCNGARIRFAPEVNDPDNAGLRMGMKQLDDFLIDYGPYDGLTYADLYTLAGAVAVEDMGGNVVPWRPGRKDATDGSTSPQHGRLPAADGDATHVRNVFERLGFNESQTVALIGAHTLGCAHKENSGYDGCWVAKARDTVFDNEFFVLLKSLPYVKYTVPETGKEQFVLDTDKQLMMLPADMALLQSPFRQYVDVYAADNERFLTDFSQAFSQLLEGGADLQGDYYDRPLSEICSRATDSAPATLSSFVTFALIFTLLFAFRR